MESSTLADRGTELAGVVSGGEGLVAAARGLRELLWEQAPACDRERRLTDTAVAAITDAGLMRLLTPRRHGGHQADMQTFLEVTTALGHGCTSSAWVTGVLNVGNFAASLYPEATQHQIWADNPDTTTALVLGSTTCTVRRTDDGGIRITGKWPYASGSLHARWITVLVPVPNPAGPPAITLALVPIHQTTIEDTWHFTGMRGTGSATVALDDVPVPTPRLLPFLPLFNAQAETVTDTDNPYRNSLAGLFSVGLIGPIIGATQAALEWVLEQAPTRRVAFSGAYSDQTKSPTFQLDVAAAARRLDTAKLHAQRIATLVDQHAHAGTNPDLLTRAQMRMDSTHVTQQCREALDTLLTAYGSSAFNETNPLQRIWRDVNVASRHVAFGMGIPEQLYGRALIGHDPREISYLV